MLDIRKAKAGDKDAVIGILKDLDIYYSALKFKDFWVASLGDRIIGTAQLEEGPDFLYLGSLAVIEGQRKKGVAGALLNKLLSGHKKDVYLYSTIPEFFSKFGFKPANPLSNLPSKARYECDECHLDKCVCMVKKA
jgi:N-acetylglutamate synthase-like GNAT family acetyltransferase